MQLRPVDQLDVPPAGEGRCLLGESPARDEIPTWRALGRHHSVQPAYDIDTNLERLPLLALDDELLAAPR